MYKKFLISNCYYLTTQTYVRIEMEDIHMDIIKNFGFQSGREFNKFQNIDYKIDNQDIKYRTKGSATMFSCIVNQMIDSGTHFMFIAEVVDTRMLSEEEVLTYSTYHEKKKGVTPKNAPSYIEETTQEGYCCNICGFIYETER